MKYMGMPMGMQYKGGFFSSKETEEFKKRFPIRVETGNGYIGWVQSPVNFCSMNDLTLRLHIAPRIQDEIEIIYQNMKYPPVYPSLGRHQDLIRIDKLKIVDIMAEERKIEIDMAAYAQAERYGSGRWNVRLRKDYVIQDKRRIFNFVKAAYISQSEKIITTHIDSDGDPVFLC